MSSFKSISNFYYKLNLDVFWFYSQAQGYFHPLITGAEYLLQEYPDFVANNMLEHQLI